MRIGFMFTGVFWGLLLILVGIAAILRNFDINIPIFRLIFGFFLIYFGISLLVGGPLFTVDGGPVIFSDTDIVVTDAEDDQFDIIFRKGVIDLTAIKPEDEDLEFEIDTVFASTVVKINPDVPVKYEIESAFASAQMPDGNSISFGDYEYTSDSGEDDIHYIIIKGDVVFGSLEIVED